MAQWEKPKNIVFLNNKFLDIATSGSGLSSFENDSGYITSASIIGNYVSSSTFNSFTSSYYLDSASFENRITILESTTGSFTGSFATNLISDGTVTASVHTSSNIFLITSASNQLFQVDNQGTSTFNNNIGETNLKINSDGIINFSTQSTDPVGAAPFGGFLFTSHSLYIGLE